MNVGADGNSQAAARPGWAKRLVFSALAIASILAMIELGLRGQRAWQDWRASGQGPIKPSGDVYRPHPFVYLVPTPGRYVDSQGYEETINSRGFRGPEVAVPKPAGVFRIACLGASTTIGTYQRRDRDTYPAVLERLLREARPGARVEVVNAGIAGAASAQNATNFLARVVPLEPDGIVLYDNYNDLKWATPSVFRDDWSHLQVETQARPLLWAFVEQFELYRRLVALREDLAVLRQVAEDDRRHGREYEEAERDPARASTVFEPARLAYERSLRSLAGMARAHGVRAAFCTYTTLLCLNMTEEQKRKSVQVLRLVPGYTLRGVLAGIDAFNETMREQARAQDVLLVDAAKDFPKDLEHFVEHVHHTDKGAALLASRVARVLLEAGWLDARGPVRSH